MPRLTQDLPHVVRLAIQVCDGMLHVLSQGVHGRRDIKPSNCHMTQDGTLKVTAVSLVPRLVGLEAESDRTPESSIPDVSSVAGRRSTVADTGAYMAPELFDTPQQVDVRADVYAFGVMLFQMATGTLPFMGQTWQEWAHLQRTQPPPLLNAEAALLSPLIMACLVKDPVQRHVDFRGIRKQLAEIYTRLTQTPALPPVVGTAFEAVQWTNIGTGLARG
jgi:serine/threonine protein kinase